MLIAAVIRIQWIQKIRFFIEIDIFTAVLFGIHSGTIIARSSVIFSTVSEWPVLRALGALLNGTDVVSKKGSAQRFIIITVISHAHIQVTV